MSIVFASLMFLIEEIKNVFRYYKESRIIQSLIKKHDRFEELSFDERDEVRGFFNAKICQLDGAQKMICRESSIQVVLQLTLIAYQETFQARISNCYFLSDIIFLLVQSRDELHTQYKHSLRQNKDVCNRCVTRSI